MIGILLGLAAQSAVAVTTHAQLPYPLRNYISPDDYPAAAVRSKAQGIVTLRLAVKADGWLSDCTVVKSSGWSALDSATCNVLRRRLKFTPARSATGEPTTDIVDVVYEWHVPPPEFLAHMR